MKVTEVRINPAKGGKVRAFASIVIDDCFIVNDLRVMEGREGQFFVTMPARKARNGQLRDIAHPLKPDEIALGQGIKIGRIDDQLFLIQLGNKFRTKAVTLDGLYKVLQLGHLCLHATLGIGAVEKIITKLSGRTARWTFLRRHKLTLAIFDHFFEIRNDTTPAHH